MSCRPDPVRALRTGQATPRADPGYSVLVYFLDDLGVEFMDWMGVGERTDDPNFQYAKTPFMTSIAQESGVWFSQFYGTSRCDPSRVMLNTGLLQHRTGVGQNIGQLGHTQYFVPDAHTFLAEHLRSVNPNIATAAFGKWQMCDFHSAPVVNGGQSEPPDFNLNDPARFGYQAAKITSQNYGGSYEWWKIADGGAPTWISGPPFDEDTYTLGVLARDAAVWLTQRTTPFFAYVAIGPPHSPINVPPYSMLSTQTRDELIAAGLAAGDHPSEGYSSAQGRLAYRACLEASDRALSNLWTAIPARLRARTCLMVIGDNGTSTGIAPPEFVHHKDELYQGGLQVPCLVRAPFVARPGREIKSMASLEDVFRTVAEIMRCPIPAGPIAQDSVSFLPALMDSVDCDDPQALKQYVISQEFTPVGETNPANWSALTRGRSITDGRYRYTVPKERDPSIPGLFDRFTDPFELLENDLAGTGHPKEAELEAALEAVLPI